MNQRQEVLMESSAMVNMNRCRSSTVETPTVQASLPNLCKHISISYKENCLALSFTSGMREVSFLVTNHVKSVSEQFIKGAYILQIRIVRSQPLNTSHAGSAASPYGINSFKQPHVAPDLLHLIRFRPINRDSDKQRTLQKNKIHAHLGETILLPQLHDDLTNKLDVSPNSISPLIFLESKDYTYVIIGVTLGAVLAIGFVAVIICMIKAKVIDSVFGESDGRMDKSFTSGMREVSFLVTNHVKSVSEHLIKGGRIRDRAKTDDSNAIRNQRTRDQ
ncbi:hypothetical protein DUI87_11695 [Hirundo rustica rustica]|uniref:Uncharacterized protein n=1 Tax=Hirundo rustica rustica TaxID=333673 RepID=A0A3M0KEV5_HIRRU|nr:hypothetical protein DUI87_11695 [Hirundo rustica rustica]